MAIKAIQAQKQMTGDSDTRGNVWSTFNCDFTDNPDATKITRTIAVHNAGTATVLDGVPCAFSYIPSDALYTVAGRYVYYRSRSGNDVPNRSSWTAHAGTGFPTTCDSDISDCKWFPASSELYVTTASNTVYKVSSSSGAWSTFTAGGSDTSNQHLLCQFGDRMYMTRVGNQVISWNSSDSVVTVGSTYAIDVSAFLDNITFLIKTSNRMWIGGLANYTTQFGQGCIIEWDGASAQPTKVHYTNNLGVVSGVVLDDVPYAMDVEGNLLGYTGSSFKPLGDSAKLPLRDYVFADTLDQNDPTDSFVHSNGMAVIKGKICIFVKNKQYDSNGTIYPERIPSGIYEYDPNIGLYHKWSVSRNTASNNKDDFGQSVIKLSGALCSHQSLGIDNSSTNEGYMLFGCGIYATDGTSNEYILGTNNSQTTSGNAFERYATYTTAKFMSDSITDIWQKFVARFKKLPSSGKIIVKYRTHDPDIITANITWASTTTFTTTTDLSSYVGYEVNIISGSGAGKCSHIVSVSGSGTYTVTVDETYANVSTNSAIAQVQNWTKISSITSNDIQFKTISLPTTLNSAWIQLKLCLNWTGDSEFYDLTILNKFDEPLT